MVEYSFYTLRKEHLERYVLFFVLATIGLVIGGVMLYVGDKAPRSIRGSHMDIIGLGLFVVFVAMALVYRHKRKFKINVTAKEGKLFVEVNDPVLPQPLLINDPVLVLQWAYQEFRKGMKTKMLYFTFFDHQQKALLTLKANWGLIREIPQGFEDANEGVIVAQHFYEVGKTVKLVEVIDVYRNNK